MKRNSIKDILALKEQKTPIVCLTAYTYPQARILDEHCDILLVGDSIGMVLYGYDSTLPVSLDMMIEHAKAVVKGSQKAMVVVDMPFGSYQNNREVAFDNCSRVMKETGAQAVKMEGGVEMADTIRYLVERGIPVVGHIGMQPQRVNIYGGFGTQGRTDESRNNIISDAKAIEKAGVFAFVLEAVTPEVADDICGQVKPVVIGIGAGNKADGQVLVAEDMLGYFEKTAKFVKKYADLKSEISKAASQYAKEVRSRRFPEKN